MGKFLVRGGNALRGSVTVDGAKNAALPLLFAALTLFGVSEIRGLPDIGDVRAALLLIEEQGAVVTRRGNVTYINTEHLSYKPPSARLVSQLRASTYLIGACLSRFGRIELCSFGGCGFSYRPIDFHLSLAQKMGARLTDSALASARLTPTEVEFPCSSVGATVNFLIMASSIEGESRLKNPATEPHIDTLIDFLRSAGAEIRYEDGSLCVSGGALSGGRASVRGDPIEAGTLLAASLITGGAVRVFGADPRELSPFLTLLENGGATVDTALGITVTGMITEPLRVVAAPHPGFPTDLQPIVAPLMSAFAGGNILDTVWRDRYGYLSELAKLGATYVIDERGASVLPSELVGGSAAACDLRGGAACIIAALGADGYSEITSAHTVLRGYAQLTEKLCALGADVEYISF